MMQSIGKGFQQCNIFRHSTRKHRYLQMRSYWIASTAAFWVPTSSSLCLCADDLLLSFRSDSNRIRTFASQSYNYPRRSSRLPASRNPPPDFTIDDDDGEVRRDGNFREKDQERRRSNYSSPSSPSSNDSRSRPERSIRRTVIAPGEASWLERNAKFVGVTKSVSSSNLEDDDFKSELLRSNAVATQTPIPNATPIPERCQPDPSANHNQPRSPPSEYIQPSGPVKTFREDFQGTRMFVSGLPEDCTWQDLKDHFRLANVGEVIFASVSLDRDTGQSKGHGIVQMETTAQAAYAIEVLNQQPMNGKVLSIRPDKQEVRHSRASETIATKEKGPTPPSKWKCANEENTAHLSDERRRALIQLLRARDQARFRKNYIASDSMRTELLKEYSVHVDDRLKLWWTATDNIVPDSIREIKGPDGRWGDRTTSWRQIPTIPDQDACVDQDLVEGLLKQRDIARREKDFATADRLLEQARTAPDNNLTLRIHDESRTWRIWTDDPPPAQQHHQQQQQQQQRESPQKRWQQTQEQHAQPTEEESKGEITLAELCVTLVQKYDPEKVPDVYKLLEKFKGEESVILKKLQQRYLM